MDDRSLLTLSDRDEILSTLLTLQKIPELSGTCSYEQNRALRSNSRGFQSSVNPLIIGSEVEPYAAKTAPFYAFLRGTYLRFSEYDMIISPGTPTDVNYLPYTCINNNIVLSKMSTSTNILYFLCTQIFFKKRLLTSVVYLLLHMHWF